MPAVTNKLVANSRRIAVPAAAVLVLAGGLFFQHNVHASSDHTAAALDDQSVSSLVSLDQAVEAVAARVSPAVVNVAVTSRGGEHEASMQDSSDSGDGNGPNDQQQGLPPGFAQFFGPNSPFAQGQGQGGRQQQPQQQPLQHGIGSGIIISPDGYIITNNHVVDGAVQIKVTLNDRRIMTAKLIGVDKLTDLAVIKIDATSLPSLPWGDSSKLKPGQTVLAFGSPFGYFQNSVTRGIVSAVNRQNPYEADARKPGGFIQTDAAINPGNSGGALVDAHGELIGINTFIISNSGSFAGAGFAIPAQIAQSVSEQLIKSGSVHHGYLGISMNDVTPDNAHFFKLQDANGAIVAQVTPDSPASRAGLVNGDVITSLNGHQVINGSALQVAVSEDTPGTKISIGILRDGAAKTLSLTVGEYHANTEEASTGDAAAPDGGKSGKLGLAVANLTPDVRSELQLPANLKGVAVQTVRPQSPAEDAGLAPGDVILEVDRQSTASADQFVSQVHASPASKDLLLLVWSRGNASYRLIHPEG
jgi:serine protease Do